MTELYISDDKCCGCGACHNICPKQAILMKENATGFIYPTIDKSKCIKCGLCKSVCMYQNEVKKTKTIVSYAAASKNRQTIKKASSGGIFSVCAEHVLKNGGIVYGAAFTQGHSVCHTRVNSVEDLYKIQGSKYVQSGIGTTYRQAKDDLQQGRKVLFSGTPCQIAGLKCFLKRDYDNLV